MSDAYDDYRRIVMRPDEGELRRLEQRRMFEGFDRFAGKRADLVIIDDAPNPYWRNGWNARPDITEADLRKMAYGPKIKANTQAIKDMTKATRGVFATTKEKRDMAIYKYKNAEGKEVYGKRLVIDGTQWVMKEVGTGTIYAISPKAATEVLPYTVAVQFLSDVGSAHRSYHYAAKEGEVAVGDLLWLEGTSGLAKVVDVGTKYKSAVKPLSGWKLSGSPLTSVEVEND